VAVEALRVWGKEFLFRNPKKDGDYVWGTLVKQMSRTKDGWTIDAPTAKVQVGDIIQYRDVAFPRMTVSHHTSVVAVVDPLGFPKFVYEQNVGRPAMCANGPCSTTPLTLPKMTGGTVWIYRPTILASKPKHYKIVVLNNAGPGQSLQACIGGRPVVNMTPSAPGLLGSFQLVSLPGKATRRFA